MGLASDMARLRREVDELRSARIAMRHRLVRFGADLHHTSVRRRSELRKLQGRQAARLKAMLSGFRANCCKNVGEMLGGFRREGAEARRMFFGKRHAGRKG